MEEIKADEILRTADGKLYKIVSATKDDFLCVEIRKNATKLKLLSDLEPIVGHSKSIINLIEYGDYVNGYKVIKIFIDAFTKKTRIVLQTVEMNWQGDISEMYLDDKDIKSVVTHEQFNKIKYIVGDDKNAK